MINKMINKKNLIVIGMVAIAAIFNYSVGFRNEKEIYNEKINQKEVLYKEDTARGGNRMRVKNGNTIFDLYDIVSFTRINKNKDDNEKLECIVITDEKKNKKMYNVRDIEKGTLYGEHTAKVFEKGNVLYNELRSEIREKIKDNYQTIEQKIPQGGK